MRSERCEPIVRHYILDFAGLLFLSTKLRGPQNIKESKTFTFFCVDCSIADAKLVFVFVPRYSVVSYAWTEIGVQL